MLTRSGQGRDRRTRVVGGLSWALLAGAASVAGAGAAEPGWDVANGYRSRALVREAGGKAGFTRVEPGTTGVTFTNVLAGDQFLTNFVAHNGAGLAIGDVDGDGRPDLYFCNLQGPNRLYLNRGAWRFDAAELGDAACADQASTGAVIADVDGDGDSDLLVNGIAAGTRLFLNDGAGHLVEGRDAGLSRTASSTSMAIADIDGDGDLDLYCTHFIDAMLLADPTSRFAIARKGDQWEVTKFNGESTRTPRWKGRFEALPGGKVRELPEVHGLYRNEGGGRFRAIEHDAGTYSDSDGRPIPAFRDWGLAAMFRDFNGDGHPDLYVCNDNTSPDRIWINTGKGTFRLVEPSAFRHTSRSSMGVDVGDLDRDGFDDLIVVDMLAREPSRRMTQQVRDRPGTMETENVGFRPQFNRNTLFFGQPGGWYVEAALWAGVAATDWTWCPILIDVDLDGFEDLLVTNGFQFDVMDQDSDDRIRDPRQRLTDAQLKRSMQFRPPFRTRNMAFRNRGDGSFESVGAGWGFEHDGVSYGMATGDLDGDGDLDLVVNHLNEVAGIYRNDATAPRLAVRLKGRTGNPAGVGARIELLGGTVNQSQEMIGGGRYLSGDEPLRVFAATTKPGEALRLEVRWRDGARSVVSGVRPDRIYEIAQPGSTGSGGDVRKPTGTSLFVGVGELARHEHFEAEFDDATTQLTLPKRLSRLGPGVACGDLDGDGWDDWVIPSGKGGRLAAFFNEGGRGFRKTESETTTSGDQHGVVIWPDGKGNRRILVAVSGYENGPDAESAIAVYDPARLRLLETLSIGDVTPGPLAVADVDGDGDLDLFVGGRFRRGRYPEPVASWVWINQHGTLKPDPTWSETFRTVGMVGGATFADFDGDGGVDLALSVEWGPVKVFRNRSSRFEEVTDAWGLADSTGWWTSVVAGDFDADGRMDLACGNWGRNSIHELHRPSRFRLYYGDWNREGAVRMLEAWGSGTNWYPVRDRAWLARGMPELPSRFPTHEAFGNATLAEILGPACSDSAYHEAVVLESSVFLNRGGRFERKALPREAQWAPALSLSVADGDGDGREDLWSSQNFFGSYSDLTRDDGGRGLFLRGDGQGGFEAWDSERSGISALGEQRGAALGDFDRDGRVDWVLSQSGGPTRWFRNETGRPGLRVTLAGPPTNPDGIGSVLRVIYPGGSMGPVRIVRAGSGQGSQDSATPILGLLETPEAVWVRWPGGRETRVPVPKGQTGIRLAAEK